MTAGSPTPVWRLILDPAGEPAWNMAVDGSLLRGAEGRGSGLTLRLYSWSPPGLSLGRFQPELPGPALRFCRSAGIRIVRRPTGGGGVLHDDEITYSLSGPLGEDGLPRSVVDLCRRVASALRLGLRRLGIRTSAPPAPGPPIPPRSFTEPCFSRLGKWEICWRGRKLVGSAQARYRHRFLQHGSLPIRLDPDRLFRASGTDPVTAGRLPAVDLTAALGRIPSREEIAAALVYGFRAEFGVRFRRGVLSRVERQAALVFRASPGAAGVAVPRAAGEG